MEQSESLPARVVAAFGGLTKTAKALGQAPISTVDSWVRKGQIPPWRVRDIRAAAERENITLPEDFPNPESDPAERLVPRYGTP